MDENTSLISLKNTGEFYEIKTNISIFGVGGAGCNAIKNMVAKNMKEVKFIAANTDVQSLKDSDADIKIQLGRESNKGQGAGSDPKIGAIAAEESQKEIEEALTDTNLLFLTAGMGGGTGTGAAPVIAKIAKNLGILTVAVVTKPFKHEGILRTKVAEQGIQELSNHVNTMIVLPNENLFKKEEQETTFEEALSMSNDVLYTGVKGIVDLIYNPGKNNIDMADVKNVVQQMGRAMMGTGEGEGEDRAKKAVQEALSNPLLENNDIHGATAVLVNFVVPWNFRMTEIKEACELINEAYGANPDTIFKHGVCYNGEMDENKIKVIIFAAGMRDARNKFVSRQQEPVKKEKSDIEMMYELSKQQEVKNNYLDNNFNNTNDNYIDKEKTAIIEEKTEEEMKNELHNKFIEINFDKFERKNKVVDKALDKYTNNLEDFTAITNIEEEDEIINNNNNNINNNKKLPPRSQASMKTKITANKEEKEEGFFNIGNPIVEEVIDDDVNKKDSSLFGFLNCFSSSKEKNKKNNDLFDVVEKHKSKNMEIEIKSNLRNPEIKDEGGLDYPAYLRKTQNN